MSLPGTETHTTAQRRYRYPTISQSPTSEPSWSRMQPSLQWCLYGRLYVYNITSQTDTDESRANAVRSPFRHKSALVGLHSNRPRKPGKLPMCRQRDRRCMYGIFWDCALTSDRKPNNQLQTHARRVTCYCMFFFTEGHCVAHPATDRGCGFGSGEEFTRPRIFDDKILHVSQLTHEMARTHGPSDPFHEATIIFAAQHVIHFCR